MKKIIIGMIALILVTGCGKNDVEKEEKFYNSLESSYVSIYATDGVGLAVYDQESTEINGVTWYKVANSKYNKMSTLVNMTENVYTEDVYTKIEDEIGKKYKEIDGEFYTTSSGGCTLKYQLTEELSDILKKDIKDLKISGSKATFKYDGKEYKAKLVGDYYQFSEKIFKCVEDK